MMRKYRGIVCEKKAHYTVFLTENGEFLRGTPLITDVQIGEEAEFHLISSATSTKRMKPIFIAPALVAAVLLIFLVASSWFPQTTTAYAYIQVEGDSTIEIGVDDEGNVISLHSTTGVMKDWEGQSIDLVLAKAVEQVSTDKKELVVTTIYEKEDKPKLKKQIEKAVQKVKKAKSPTQKSSMETKPKNTQPTKQEKTKPPGQIKKEEKSPNPNTPATKKEQKNPPNPNTTKPHADKEDKNEPKVYKELPAKESKPTNPGQQKKKNEDNSNNKTNNGNTPDKNNGNNNNSGNGNNKNSNN